MASNPTQATIGRIRRQCQTRFDGVPTQTDVANWHEAAMAMMQPHVRCLTAEKDVRDGTLAPERKPILLKGKTVSPLQGFRQTNLDIGASE
jgi:hypothetical protein